MDAAAFDAWAADLVTAFAAANPGHHLFLAVFPPGAFSFPCEAGPYSVSTLPVPLTAAALRALAGNLEGGDVELSNVVIKR